MASAFDGSDAWHDLCKSLGEREPLDILKICRFWLEASRLPAIDSPVDVSPDLRTFSRRNVPLDSEEIRGWWSQVQASPLLVTRTPLRLEEWQYLMEILAEADVSQIEHLLLSFDDIDSPDYSGPPSFRDEFLQKAYIKKTEDINLAHGLLKSVLLCRDFSALKTLMVYIPPDLKFGIDESLGDALKGARLINLRTLALPPPDTYAVLDALSESSISQLTSISICFTGPHGSNSKLDRAFRSGRLDSLQSVYVDYTTTPGFNFFWKIFFEAIKSGNLPKVTRLHLINYHCPEHFDLADLVRSSVEWFGSLEALTMESCCITSEQVCSLVDAIIMEVPKTQLALRSLCVKDNDLDDQAVDALLRLVDSHRLPHLQALDFSNTLASQSLQRLVILIESIRKGGLPSLQKLNWGFDFRKLKMGIIVPIRQSMLLSEIMDAKAIVQAYYEDQSLTTDIVGINWEAYDGASLETKFKTYRGRNLRLAVLRGRFAEDFEGFVPLTYAKVFLCGFPGVGKTTLRRALRRSLGIRTKFTWETRPDIFKEPRTRGIEISRIEADKKSGHNTTLVVWDLAGQEEYHVLHSTFIPDLGFVGGKATTFTLVFKATFQTNVREKLWYWLRFVASSSGGLVRRHVIIVLNRFDNKLCAQEDQTLWKALIHNFATIFSDLLDIHLDPIIVDVRKAALVQPLKDHLFNHAQAMLCGIDVPGICVLLHKELKGWSEGENNNHLPIFTWQAFEETWRLTKGNHFSTRTLRTAASSLHEMGEIIYFEKEDEKQSGDKSIVIPNPEWFCRKVVGELLLPKQMLEGGSSLRVRDDGSVSLFMFEAFFKDLLVGGIQSNDVISVLEIVGLCYKKTEGEIIIPALIRKDDYQSINWDSKGFRWVMGRCLATKDTERNIIPVTLFRRLQVELALDVDFGRRGDTEYRVGKSFVNFKVGQLLVLIQFDVDHSDPTDDRIDVLVRSAMRGDAATVSSTQVECICEIMQKLEDLCAVCCDGLTYDIKVIQPSIAADRADKMSERKLMSLQEMKDLVIKGKKYLGWQVDGNFMEPQWFLSKDELDRLVGVVQREYEECRHDAVTMGLLPEDSCDENEAFKEELSNDAFIGDVQSASVSSERNDQEGLTPKIFHEGMQKLEAAVRREGRHTRQHIDKKSTELLLEFRHEHELLVKHIQALQSFSIEEKERSVPRYMFLSKKQDQPWITLTEAFQSTYQLHLLCEAHFDDGFLHEVKGQEGIELTKSKEWLVKVSPWLRRSLQVAVLVGKTVGNVFLPGVFNLIPDVNLSNDSNELARAVDRAAAVLLEGENEGPHEQGSCGTATHPINVKEKLIAQEVVKDLISELGYTLFGQKIGLKKVLLRAVAQPHACSSAQAQPSVVWICNNCYKKYGDRASDI